MKSPAIRFCLLMLLWVCRLAPDARAQVATGTILGNVADSSGAAVPGATITATNVGTQFSRSTTSDELGQYALRLLPLGNYKLDVTLDGFKTFSRTGILLEIGRNVRIDAAIEPGNVAESVSVVANAPLVDTSSTALARSVGESFGYSGVDGVPVRRIVHDENGDGAADLDGDASHVNCSGTELRAWHCGRRARRPR